MINKYRILKIKQVLESEKKFIKKNSEKKIFKLASSKIANFLESNFFNKKIIFVCGNGNNGKDGLLASDILKNRGFQIKSFNIKELNTSNSIDFFKKSVISCDVIVDCIFGIGLNRNISGIYKKIIKNINELKNKKKIISIDVPSGINADTGEIYGINIKSDICLAMGVYKPAHFLIPSKEFCGEITLLRINLPNPVTNNPKIFLMKKEFIKEKLPNYKLNIHKYDKGHVFVVGGKMSGASRLVAYAARKVGCGLSTILVEKGLFGYYSGVEPGTIVEKSNYDLKKKKIDAFVLGPGLGKNFSKIKIINLINSISCPLVIDADALNIFENSTKEFYDILRKKKNVIITPHEGEFKRIFKFKSEDKISDCIKASKLIFNTVILKGSDTIIAMPNGKVWINYNARNSLATAGSGDLLCGIVSSLLAQKMSTVNASIVSVLIHSLLSEYKNCTTVEDFLKKIPQAFRKLKNIN